MKVYDEAISILRFAFCVLRFAFCVLRFAFAFAFCALRFAFALKKKTFLLQQQFCSPIKVLSHGQIATMG
jgi:hypothetical protein